MNVWKKLLLGVFAAIALFFAVELLFTWPVYHDFTKKVDSYDALCKPFQNSKTIFLPEEDDIPVAYRALNLDGRSLFAKPEAYTICKSEDRDGNTVRYDLTCRLKGETPCTGSLEYRGVPYDVTSYDQPSDSGIHHCVTLSFDIEHVYYRFYASYKSASQDAEETQRMEQQLRARLETYAKQVIDKYQAALLTE